MTISDADYTNLLRYDFMSFIERSFYELNPQTRLLLADYIELMAVKLDACRRGEIRRLIINLPPRYLKSHCASVALVAWILGHEPSAQVVCASYGQDLADKLARDSRTIMEAPWYQALFPTRIAPSKKAVNDFMTTAAGSRMSTSVGGVLTGRGADIIIIDDPLKPEEALSNSQRKRANDWYDSTLVTRLNNKVTGCIIIIMQRLHQDDLVGHVLEQEDWDVVNFPAIAEESSQQLIVTPLGTRIFKRNEGEPLHAAREDVQMLEQIRQRMGEYNFLSQYQQTPIPMGGAMVKASWLKYYESGEEPAKFDYTVLSCDTANKANELSDYSVFTLWGQKGKSFYLMAVFRRRLEYPDLKKELIRLAKLYRPNKILIEDKASGTQLLQDLKREGVYQIHACNPGNNDKIMRLNNQTGAFEAGQVFLPREAHWLKDYLQELLSFPGSKYDDQVDSTTQALEWLTNRPRRILEVQMVRS